MLHTTRKKKTFLQNKDTQTGLFQMFTKMVEILEAN